MTARHGLLDGYLPTERRKFSASTVRLLEGWKKLGKNATRGLCMEDG
jgi:hypothetical protein